MIEWYCWLCRGRIRQEEFGDTGVSNVCRCHATFADHDSDIEAINAEVARLAARGR